MATLLELMQRTKAAPPAAVAPAIPAAPLPQQPVLLKGAPATAPGLPPRPGVPLADLYPQTEYERWIETSVLSHASQNNVCSPITTTTYRFNAGHGVYSYAIVKTVTPAQDGGRARTTRTFLLSYVPETRANIAIPFLVEPKPDVRRTAIVEALGNQSAKALVEQLLRPLLADDKLRSANEEAQIAEAEEKLSKAVRYRESEAVRKRLTRAVERETAEFDERAKKRDAKIEAKRNDLLSLGREKLLEKTSTSDLRALLSDGPIEDIEYRIPHPADLKEAMRLSGKHHARMTRLLSEEREVPRVPPAERRAAAIAALQSAPKFDGSLQSRARAALDVQGLSPTEPPISIAARRNIDRWIVGFSGGKDSIACVLNLLDLGIAKDKIELWHHKIDPDNEPFMDWPSTHAYCRAIADALHLPIYFSERVGGFEREMLKDGTVTAPVRFERPRGPDMTTPEGTTAKPGVRLKFPQVSADLSVRWCSSVLKIDVAARVFSSDPRLSTGTYVFVTGERAEESTNRANYLSWEFHRSDNLTRRIFQWRPVQRWSEERVWDAMRRWGVLPHPAYALGFGRVSCMSCIFGNPDQWATVKALNPAHFDRIADYVDQFGVTIQRKRSVREQAAAGRSIVPAGLGTLARRSQDPNAEWPVLVDPHLWTFPAGAFRVDGGPG